MLKVPSAEYQVPSKITVLLLGLLCLLTACNLQQNPVEVTPTLQPTPTALSQPTAQPTRTPIGQPTAQPNVNTPALPIIQTPTALQLGGITPNPSGGTVIPTVSTQEAVKSTTIQAAAGKMVGLNYAVTQTAGSLTLTMQGPDGVVWQKTFTASETGRIEVTIQQAGAYDVMAHTDRFGGHYELSWD
jgi:hypothetical protein